MKMTKSPHLSVILPSYMEEENLRLLLPRLKDALSQNKFESEILVIDTQKPLDATQELCVSQGVRHVRRGPGGSFGDAIRTGIGEAKGKWILCMDADGSHTPEFIPSLIHEADKNDIVIASRYIEGGFTENTPSLISN